MRLKTFVPVILLAIAFGTGDALAEQGCADGFIPNPVPGGTPGQNQCVPIPGQNRGPSGGGGAEVRWARRWGAFAADTAASKVGLSTGMTSKRKAEKAAQEHCRSKGGVQCKTLLAYYDQCGAVAWGPMQNGRGDLISANAPRKKEAEELALQDCSRTSDKCEIFFSECSYPERMN
jgi:hypothetical protein